MYINYTDDIFHLKTYILIFLFIYINFFFNLQKIYVSHFCKYMYGKFGQIFWIWAELSFSSLYTVLKRCLCHKLVHVLQFIFLNPDKKKESLIHNCRTEITVFILIFFRLPMSHTCFNMLVLPAYKSKKTMKLKLIHAVQNAEGFGLEWERQFDIAEFVAVHVHACSTLLAEPTFLITFLQANFTCYFYI